MSWNQFSHPESRSIEARDTFQDRSVVISMKLRLHYLAYVRGICIPAKKTFLEVGQWVRGKQLRQITYDSLPEMHGST
jgi:hypothetical protein